MSSWASLLTKKLVLAANIVDGYPSEYEYLRDFLVEHGAQRITTISSPLERRSRARTVIRTYEHGKLMSTVSIPRPNIPPFTFVIDFLLVLPRIKCDLWIGFNPIMTSIGIMSRSKKIANWAIDFVPSRGSNFIAEKSYRAIEKFAMKNLSIQIENTPAAMNARTAETGYSPPIQLIAPIGVWESSFAEPIPGRHQNRSVVYFGSLDIRNGAPFLLEILQATISIDKRVKFRVVGDGPYAPQFSSLAERFPEQVDFRGYMENQDEIDEILRTAVVAVAPYSEVPGQFTQFADPQKLKYYAANGLPVILTEVAPAAAKMRETGACTILRQADGPDVWAKEIISLLDDPDRWLDIALNSYRYSIQFNRELIYSAVLTEIDQYLNS